MLPWLREGYIPLMYHWSPSLVKNFDPTAEMVGMASTWEMMAAIAQNRMVRMRIILLKI